MLQDCIRQIGCACPWSFNSLHSFSHLPGTAAASQTHCPTAIHCSIIILDLLCSDSQRLQPGICNCDVSTSIEIISALHIHNPKIHNANYRRPQKQLQRFSPRSMEPSSLAPAVAINKMPSKGKEQSKILNIPPLLFPGLPATSNSCSAQGICYTLFRNPNASVFQVFFQSPLEAPQ